MHIFVHFSAWKKLIDMFKNIFTSNFVRIEMFSFESLLKYKYS
jgi:hypothetical protein